MGDILVPLPLLLPPALILMEENDTIAGITILVAIADPQAAIIGTIEITTHLFPMKEMELHITIVMAIPITTEGIAEGGMIALLAVLIITTITTTTTTTEGTAEGEMIVMIPVEKGRYLFLRSPYVYISPSNIYLYI